MTEKLQVPYEIDVYDPERNEAPAGEGLAVNGVFGGKAWKRLR